MPVSREAAIRLAIDFYASQGFAVIRSRDELPGVHADRVLVVLRVAHSTENPFHPPEMAGRYWWVAFDGLEREGESWVTPSIHPSGGLVRVDEATGELYQPTLL